MPRALVVVTLTCLAGTAAWAQGTSFSAPVECAPPAQPGTPAELRTRAQEHFSQAALVYDLGEYERAVDEFTVSFCLYPTLEAAKNIGQSYYSLLDFEKAVLWFKYYIYILPPGERQKATTVEGRIVRLEKLPARIRVATDPRGAMITISDGQKEV